MYKDMDEQLKLAHKVFDVEGRANRKICATLLRYNVDKLESSFAQVRLFAMSYKLEEFIYLLNVKIYVEDKVVSNQPN